MVRDNPPASGDGENEDRTEVTQKRLQRGFRIARPNDAIVVAGDGEDRRRIVAVGIEELIVVVIRFAEVVDQVAEVEEERRHIGGVRLAKVGHHLVGDQILCRRAFDATGIADAVKDNLAGGGDGLGFPRALAAVSPREGEHRLDGVARRLGNRLNRGDLLVALVGHRISKAGGVGRGLRLSENWIACGRRRSLLWLVCRLLWMPCCFFRRGVRLGMGSPRKSIGDQWPEECKPQMTPASR